jgi:hypothetical protein
MAGLGTRVGVATLSWPGETSRQAPRLLFAGLDLLQQRIVGALAEMPWIWRAPPGERIPADNPLWGYGLPNTHHGLQAYVSLSSS